MKISNVVHFEFELALGLETAVRFVQDVQQSLSKASFIHDMQLWHDSGQQHLRASIAVNAALFGQHDLSFESIVHPEAQGAWLEPQVLSEKALGWAEVGGRARVQGLAQGSHVSYDFDITIHLDLPEPEKWGGRALLKMIHFTAERVLSTITEAFPAAVQEAADAFEAELRQQYQLTES